MTKLRWEKAKAPRRRKKPVKRRDQGLAQVAMAEFVVRHGIGCFKCGARSNEWAKTGISRRGAWAVCLPCVRRPSD